MCPVTCRDAILPDPNLTSLTLYKCHRLIFSNRLSIIKVLATYIQCLVYRTPLDILTFSHAVRKFLTEVPTDNSRFLFPSDPLDAKEDILIKSSDQHFDWKKKNLSFLNISCPLDVLITSLTSPSFPR